MQSVIVYRNPLEAAIWESLMNGGFIIVAAFIVAALIGVAVYAQIERLHHRAYRSWQWSSKKYGAIATLYLHNGKISIAAGLLALFAMHLWNMYG